MTEEEEISMLKDKIHELEALTDPFRLRLREIKHSQFLREIPLAMKDNMVWCRNARFALEATPCQDVKCPFKANNQRLATPAELGQCNTFQITKPSPDWYNAQHVFPRTAS